MKGFEIMDISKKRWLQAGLALFCSVAVTLSALPALADEDIESLENQTSALENELAGINQDILDLNDDINTAEMQIEILQGEIGRTSDALAEAETNEQQQYEDMKTRIKYMYENGNASLLEMLFSAEDMTDFLNKADFIEHLSEYDRNALNELENIHQEIADQKTALEEQQASMVDLQAELEKKKTELQAKADETSTDLKEVNAKLEQITLMAALLDCEAHHDYDAMLAVATVIMNRVEDPRFPNTIKGVIFAKGQFEPVWTGRLDAALDRGPTSLAVEVTEDAVNGKRLASVADCYFFLYAPYTDRDGVIIGDNVFFRSW